MDIKACHKSLAALLVKALNLSFIRGMQQSDLQNLFCNDTDHVQYQITGVNQKVILNFMCIDLEKIFDYAGKYLVQTYYPDIFVKVGQYKHQKVLQLVIDNESLSNISKNFKQVQESGIKTGKKKLDAVFSELSKRLACIKRHFFASPFQMMLIATKNNYENKPAQNLPNLSFYTKPDKKQKIWLAFEKNQFTVYYGITFEDRFEQQLARIYFSELVDARKHVHNAPSVTVTQSQLSEFLISSFPEQKKQKYQFTNGIVALTLFGKLVKNPESMASYLGGFRNYSYYHIQASKCYLHSRVLRRINNFHRDLNLSKIDQLTNK